MVDVECVVVFYYEVDSIDAGEFVKIKESGDYCHDLIKHSEVSEVVKWIKSTDLWRNGTI